MAFGDRLKELRNRRNKSQAELAEDLKVAKSTISMYERGERNPDFETLEAIADYFNVDMNYLLGKDDGSVYYLDPEAAEMAQELYKRPEMKVLFDASRKATREDIEQVAEILKKLGGK